MQYNTTVKKDLAWQTQKQNQKNFVLAAYERKNLPGIDYIWGFEKRGQRYKNPG